MQFPSFLINVVYMKWVGYALPIELAERIKKDKDPWTPVSILRHSLRGSLSLKIRAALGYSSDGSFVQEAVRRHLNSKEREYDAIQEEREVGRRVLGKKDPGDL